MRLQRQNLFMAFYRVSHIQLIIGYPEKLLHTVGNPARSLLNSFKENCLSLFLTFSALVANDKQNGMANPARGLLNSILYCRTECCRALKIVPSFGFLALHALPNSLNSLTGPDCCPWT